MATHDEHTETAVAMAGNTQAAGLAESATPTADETARRVTEALADRLADWLRQQPEVGEVNDLGMGIYGIGAGGPNEEPIAISLTIQPTQ